MDWQPPTLARIEPVKRAKQSDVQKVIREVIAAHPEDYVLAGDWIDGVLEVIKKMIPVSASSLLDELLTAERSHENVEKLQQEAFQEEMIQRAAKADKPQAEANGEDIATVKRPEKKKAKKEEKKDVPIDGWTDQVGN